MNFISNMQIMISSSEKSGKIAERNKIYFKHALPLFI